MDDDVSDRPHDAEALFAASGGTCFWCRRKMPDATALYRVPALAGSRNRQAAATGAAPLERVTGGAASPDGNWVALGANTDLLFYLQRQT